MINKQAFSEYQQTAAIGSSALSHVVALYETMLRDFRRAMIALEQGDIEKRVFEVNHALRVLGALQGSLDFEKGGAAATQLDRFYAVCHAEVLRVSVAPTRAGLQGLIDLIAPVHQAWDELAKKGPIVPPREAPQEVRISMSEPITTRKASVPPPESSPPSVWRS
ncbi:MAG TPA: flagellar export chaperone FliS [Dongiaceae bacterium]|nr:flagellar export chaperone FliS [Dongiaceae bacterium]